MSPYGRISFPPPKSGCRKRRLSPRPAISSDGAKLDRDGSASVGFRYSLRLFHPTNAHGASSDFLCIPHYVSERS